MRCYIAYALRHLICHHHHLGQLGVGIVWALPLFLFCLFVRVCPVEYLFLYELSCRYGPEWCARQIEIRTRLEGHQLLVIHFSRLYFAGIVRILFYYLSCLRSSLQGGVFLVIEVLGVLAPGAIVVFIQHYAVPIYRLYPFVCGLDASHSVLAQHILE